MKARDLFLVGAFAFWTSLAGIVAADTIYPHSGGQMSATELRLDHWTHSKPFWVEGGFKEDILDAVELHGNMSDAEALETMVLIEGIIDVRYREALLRERLHAGEITGAEYDSLATEVMSGNPLRGDDGG